MAQAVRNGIVQREPVYRKGTMHVFPGRRPTTKLPEREYIVYHDVVNPNSPFDIEQPQERIPTSTIRLGSFNSAPNRTVIREVDIEGDRLPESPQSKLRKSSIKPKSTLYIIIGALTMLVGIWAAMDLISWWNTTMDDIHYGRPRTYQTDFYVGHNEQPGQPTHFIAINMNRKVEIIELPGGDPSKIKVFTGPYLFGDGQNLTPVTLEFRDLNGDNNPDMIIHMGSEQMVLINDAANQTFRPVQASEHDQVQQHLGNVSFS